MGQSQRVRFSELRRAYRLIHECRDIGHDPTAWPRHAVAGLTELVGAQIGILSDVRFVGRGVPPEATILHDHGWSVAHHRDHWYRQFVHNQRFAQNLFFQRFVTLPGALVTRTREQLVDDAVWYRSVEFQEKGRLVEADDFLASIRRWSHPPRSFVLPQVRPLREKEVQRAGAAAHPSLRA